MKVQLLTDDQALDWANTEANRQAWRSLYEACPWRFPTLGPDYYRLWFEHYRSNWSPLLMLVFDPQGALKLLFPLACHGETITGAGAHQAEYQGWLSDSTIDAALLRQVFGTLQQRFPKARLRLHYLAQGIPPALLSALSRADRKLVIEPTRRPLMCLDADDIDGLLAKKSTRSKKRRLQRQGELGFCRLAQPEKIERAVKTIAVFYDLRQGAVNDSCPFHDDPAKLAFTRDWITANANGQSFFGCLALDGEPIGGLIGTLGEQDCQLAILAHDPRLSRHSPGKLIVYRAAQLLAREGVPCLDLTPGGDPWKERFANRHEPVYSLTRYPRLRDAIQVVTRRWLETWARRVLRGIGLSPAMLKRRVRRSGPVETCCAAGSLQVPDLTEIDCQEWPQGVRRGQLADLLRFSPDQWGLSRQAFLQEALARLERGEELYTLVEDDTLLAVGWLAPPGKEERIGGLRCMRGKEDLLEQVASAMLCDIKDYPSGPPREDRD